MIRKITTLILLFVAMALHGQQLPQYTQYMFTKLAHNPGYAGAGNGICVSGLVRQQWVGFKGTDSNGESVSVAPETYLVSVHAPIKILRGGLGATIVQDQIGPFNDIYLNLMYAYQTTLGAGDLGIGIQLSLLNKSLNFADFGDANDPLLLDKSEETDMYFDGGLGLYYRVPDSYYLGFSAYNLFQTKKSLGTTMQLRRQFNLMGGFEFSFPNTPAIDVMPSLLIKTDGASAQIDLTTLLRYQNKFWGGITYRYQDAVAVIIGFDYKNFNIGYSYDITTSAIGGAGSHEIRAGYCFKIEVDKVRKIYRNTRFL